MIDAAKFLKSTGYVPENDDLNRCNCNLAGKLGHQQCGWCKTCDKPVFMCKGH